jgi:peroxiredoxin
MMSLRRFVPKLDFGTVVWIGLLAFLGFRLWPQVAAGLGVASSASRQAPDYQFTTLSGDTASLAGLRGKVVLVNFWATWCPPCRVEMPGFQRVYEDHRDEGFVVLGLSTDMRGEDQVREFLAERGITYPNAMARGSIGRDFGGSNMLPTSYLIDRQGRIRNEVRGIFTSVALDQAVSRLLDEPVPPTEAPLVGGGS